MNNGIMVISTVLLFGFESYFSLIPFKVKYMRLTKLNLLSKVCWLLPARNKSGQQLSLALQHVNLSVNSAQQSQTPLRDYCQVFGILQINTASKGYPGQGSILYPQISNIDKASYTKR